jgi:hypothetical protein
MWPQITPFVEAETAYRRERIIAGFGHPTAQRHGRLPRVRPSWLSRRARLNLRSPALRPVPKHAA